MSAGERKELVDLCEKYPTLGRIIKSQRPDTIPLFFAEKKDARIVVERKIADLVEIFPILAEKLENEPLEEILRNTIPSVLFGKSPNAAFASAMLELSTPAAWMNTLHKLKTQCVFSSGSFSMDVDVPVEDIVRRFIEDVFEPWVHAHREQAEQGFYRKTLMAYVHKNNVHPYKKSDANIALYRLVKEGVLEMSQKKLANGSPLGPPMFKLLPGEWSDDEEDEKSECLSKGLNMLEIALQLREASAQQLDLAKQAVERIKELEAENKMLKDKLDGFSSASSGADTARTV